MLAIAAVVCANASAFSEPVDLSGGLPWYTTVKTWQAGTMEAAMSQAAAATTIPLWSYAVNSSRDGNTYTGTMVGRSPFYNGARETDIPTFIIPVKVVMPDTGHVFDPTAEDPFGCLPAGDTALGLTQQSPIFDAPASDWIMNGVDVGTGQYVDAFQRAAFFSDVSVTGDRYHTVLSPVTTLSTVTFNVSAGSGATYTRGCGMIGVVDITAMDFFVRTEITALAAQGVHPTTFPLFLLYNVVMGDPGDSITSNCCVIGYHGAGGAPLQTYSPTDFDSTGIFRHLANTSVFAHEVGEWMNDPTGSNPTPKWGHTGQVSGCQNNLEVGDPLSGTLFPSVTMPNGYTYDLQELAFFSWFYGSPSLGAGGFFSNNETFGSDAGQVCS
ncbi:MAG TPA: hypothetical protein VMT58_09605 [Candidatus Binataceae bacterium]|nr:hypothetical protein [Candidatus Binataceae bacterium]